MEKNAKEKFERLRATRRGHRSVTTKLTKEALELISDYTNIEVQSRLKTIATLLQGKLTVLKDLDDQILELCPVDDVEHEIEESGEIELRIIECQDKIVRAQNKTNGEISSQTSTAAGDVTAPVEKTEVTETHAGNQTEIELHTSNTQQQTQHIQATQVKAKLPKITLPKFKGSVTDWTPFWESFKAAVHDNNSISKIDKFNYLFSLLEGPAARAIQGLTLSEANYIAAIQILEERFGRTQQIISAHMDELLKIQACQNEKSSSTRFVYDKIRVHVRGLDSLGVAAEQYGSLLIPIIMSKLPASIRLQVARKSTSEVWKIDELLEAIRKEVEAREACDRVKVNEVKPPPPPPKGSQSTANALLAKQQEQRIRCAYCNENHYSASCERVKGALERKEILRRDRRCFICLRKGHLSHECSNTKGCRNCGQRHHQSICSKGARFERPKSDQEKQPPPQGAQTDHTVQETTSTTAASTARTKGKTVLLQTARCVATNEDNSNSASVRVLFDNGSQRSYVTNSLKSRLKLKPVKRENLRLNTFGDDHVKRETCDVVKFTLRKKDGERLEISALSFPVICSSMPLKVDVNKYPHLEGLILADEYEDQDCDSIDVLIGSDCYWDVVTGETLRGDSGPTAVNSKLGWLLSGPLDDVTTTAVDTYVSNLIISGDIEKCHGLTQNDDLKSTLKRFWETESIGIREREDPHNDQLPEQFLKNIRYKDNRYEVTLPWKEDQINVTTDYNHCYNRLKSLQYKLKKQPELLKEYNNTIQEQLEKEVVEEVPPEEIGSIEDRTMVTAKPVHYLPHHAVIRKDKDTTKLRVVYDGSAKSDGEARSLNDLLETGPNFIPHLFDVLVRFRWNSVALSADIEKAFLMVGIDPNDRDMLRFLWLQEPDKLNSKIIHLRFRRLVFGLRPSPAILGAAIHHHLNLHQDQYSEVVELLRKSLYVDDFLSGASSDDQAYDIYRASKEVMKNGGFNLRKWHSNSASLMMKIKQSERNEESSTPPERKIAIDDESYTKSTISSNSPSKDNSIKVLGVNWNTDLDELFFNFSELITYARLLPATKRSLLKLTAKLFDPLGFLSPFTIQLKVLFQVICCERIDWDEELQGKALLKYNSFVTDLQHLADVRLPRCYFSARASRPNNIQLHGFSDASQQAFAAAVYMRPIYDNGHVEVNLVASKTKVAPTKKQSIPRLELLGALILARLVASIRKSLSLPQDLQTVYWVDSITTLYWIRNNKPWRQYVEHRVQEIRQLSNKDQWRFCPGSQNPADLPSRGTSGKELAESKVWCNGPEFLTQTEEDWPVNPVTKDIPKSAMEEIVKNPPAITYSFSSLQQRAPVINLDKIIQCSSFSSLARLLRITAYVLRLIRNLKKAKRSKNQSHSPPTVALTASEINQAESLWIRTVQSSSFERELEYLNNNPNSSPPIYVVQFGLVIDDQHILRCQGRINNATIPESSKKPILLPSKHHFSDLVIRDIHVKIKHSGIRETLVTLRERFWVLRGREAVKRNLRKCVVCRKHEGPSYNPPQTPGLPSERVSTEPPFTYTGLDFAGPLYVRPSKETRDQEGAKAYVCLFTCASTRAVHLELTKGLSVQSFLMAFRRFTSRRGLPCTLISDNAKTFRSASKEVQTVARSEEVLYHLANNRITWSFIVEKAPWWGGFWERLIRGIKRCLKKSIGRSTLTFQELNTVIVEIEGILNARPITYVYDDEESVSYPLTPSHLVHGRTITSMPSSEHFEIASTNDALTKRAKHQRKLLQQFTSQWQREYLVSLRKNARFAGKRSNKESISVGDIVIVKSDTTKRIFWKLGRVKELLAGKDGRVRAARVRVGEKGERKPIIIRRVIQHLVPLEVHSSDLLKNSTDEVTNAPIENVQDSESPGRIIRPRRKAAVMGENIRRHSSMY